MRRGLSEDERQGRAITASRRMILSGDPPKFHLRRVEAGYVVVGFDLAVDETEPLAAIERARLLMPALLDVDLGVVRVKIVGT